MILALEGFTSATVYSRRSKSERLTCVSLPAKGSRRRFVARALNSLPVLRGRVDLLTLLSDLDFDEFVADSLESPTLFDGVAGQCYLSFKKLADSRCMRILTSLNTHVDYLTSAMAQEHRALGIRQPHFVHSRMRDRMREEVLMADRIRVPSTLAKDTFIEAGVEEERIAIVPLGVDSSHFHPVEKADSIFRVLAVSTFDPRKGLIYLLKAFEGIVAGPHELLLIGATGSRWERKTLQHFSRHITSLRVMQMDVTTEPVERSYGMASVLVHPAVEDGFGLVIPQALSCGIPVIASSAAGASELIVHGESGFIVPPRRSDLIREYLSLLANDGELCGQMGRAASASMQRRGYSDFAQHVQDFYWASLGKGRS